MTDLISFEGAPVPVRDDIPTAHRKLWERLAGAGNWWTGAERVAIAAETRAAVDCALCGERRGALSPNAVEGKHSSVSALPPAAVEVIHRVATDPARLSKSWFEASLADGLSDGQYVEIVGIVVALVSVDSFCRGLGVPLHVLPEPRAGEPSRRRPSGLVAGTAWVPMIEELGPDESDLWPGRTANVIRAMSLVPDAVRALKELSAAHYYPGPGVAPRALERMQIELIAGKVSALNECFY